MYICYNMVIFFEYYISHFFSLLLLYFVVLCTEFFLSGYLYHLSVYSYFGIYSPNRHVLYYVEPDSAWWICGNIPKYQIYWNISHCNISHKVKLEKWGTNPLLSHYEDDVLTIWLNAWTASQVASSLPILRWIFQYVFLQCWH